MASCTAKVDVFVDGLGSEISRNVRFNTTNTPEGFNAGYGTIAAANTYEAVALGQIAASTVDLVYLKAVDATIYAEVVTSTQQNVAQIQLAASEACLFRPACSTATAISIMVMSGTAGALYEYTIVGQTS